MSLMIPRPASAWGKPTAKPLSASGHPHELPGGYTTPMSEPEFFKSSHSDRNNCVEVAFRTSSYTQQQNCVEVADTPTATLVRDTQNRAAGHLGFNPGEWAALVRACR